MAAEARAREHADAQRRADQERLKRLRTIQDLQAMSGPEFEETVGKLFEQLSCRVRHTPGSGDDGIDLFVEKEGESFVVQCKRWKNDVGSPIVRDFFGSLIHAGAVHGFIITTAKFSRSARGFARGKHLTLIDGTMLLLWLEGRYAPKLSGYAVRGKPATPAPDPHTVLGLSRNATREEIRAAYRALIVQYHPDKVAQLGPELRQLATEKSAQINEAYRALEREAPQR
jgi:restriction system protein